VKIAQAKGVITGRRMRVDTTVVETDIHHPTDSTLLGDGVRVLTRIMRKITKITGAVGTKLRDRSRSVKFRLLEIGRVARAKGPINQDKLKQRYRQLLNSTSRVVGQAKRFSEEIAEGVKQSTTVLKQLVLEGLRRDLDEMMSRVRQVMKQTRARIFRGNTRSEGKLLSLFEPSTEVIRKGKAGKPNEFRKTVKLQEAENQIITDYEVYDRRPYDSDLLVAAIETHQALLARAPRLVAADAAFYSARNEAAAKAKGVKRVCIPNRSTKSPERKREQRKRWFRDGQKWRTGCEGRISVVKRRHGLIRCRYKGLIGMNRWVGLGVIADNVVNATLGIDLEGEYAAREFDSIYVAVGTFAGALHGDDRLLREIGGGRRQVLGMLGRHAGRPSDESGEPCPREQGEAEAIDDLTRHDLAFYARDVHGSNILDAFPSVVTANRVDLGCEKVPPVRDRRSTRREIAQRRQAHSIRSDLLFELASGAAFWSLALVASAARKLERPIAQTVSKDAHHHGASAQQWQHCHRLGFDDPIVQSQRSVRKPHRIADDRHVGVAREQARAQIRDAQPMRGAIAPGFLAGAVDVGVGGQDCDAAARIVPEPFRPLLRQQAVAGTCSIVRKVVHLSRPVTDAPPRHDPTALGKRLSATACAANAGCLANRLPR